MSFAHRVFLRVTLVTLYKHFLCKPCSDLLALVYVEPEEDEREAGKGTHRYNGGAEETTIEVHAGAKHAQYNGKVYEYVQCL